MAGAFLGLVGTGLLALVVLGLAIDSRDRSKDVSSASGSAAVIAAFDGWAPPTVVGGRAWVRTDRSVGTDQIRGCAHPISWTWTDRAGLTLSLVRLECRTAYAAYDVVDNYAGPIETAHFPSSGEHYAWVHSEDHSGQVVWRQRGTMLALHLACARTTTPCIAGAARLARAVDEVGGAAGKADAKPADGFGYFFAPLLVWLVMVAPVRVVQRARRQKWRSVDASPRYRDLSDVVRRARRNRSARRALWSIAVVGGAVAVLCVLNDVLLGRDYRIAAAVSGLVSVATYSLGRRVDRRKPGGPSAVARTAGLRGRLGQALRSWSAVLATAALVVYAGVLLAGGAARTVSLDQLFYGLTTASNDPSATGALQWILLTLAIGFRADLTEVIVLAVLPALLFAYALRTLGRRLQAADAEALLAIDKRPPFLYLRSFDEDKLRIPAPSLRTGPVERLVPWRRRSFERVVVDTLSRYGPVIAVSDPRARLAPIGAARASLPHEVWRDQVAKWAGEALVVVVGGTPSEVREGLAFELSVLAAAPQPRLLVVQAPYRRDDLTRRWSGFLRQAARLPLFAALLGEWVQEGTLMLTHDNTRGWIAWGARWRTDRSYALALDAALSEEIPLWYQEFGQRQGGGFQQRRQPG